MSNRVVLVTGAGGFIGGHLVDHLRRQRGVRVRAVDVKPTSEWYQCLGDVENGRLDLRSADACIEACRGANDVYQLAADMGGIGFIENHKAACMLNVLIDTHMLLGARAAGVERFFYSSSACVYNTTLQMDDATALKEADAYPAMPEDGYGWQKLFSERLCRHFAEDYGMYTRVARFHNVYGPDGAWHGGREKAPAAICRKVAEAKEEGRREIEVWGTGTQRRSFLYVQDCVRGIRAVMDGDVEEPINIGSTEVVSIDELVDIVEGIADVRLTRRYDPAAPKGVRARNSDNTLVRARVGWEPAFSLKDGLRPTFEWIRQQYLAGRRTPQTRSAPKSDREGAGESVA